MWFTKLRWSIFDCSGISLKQVATPLLRYLESHHVPVLVCEQSPVLQPGSDKAGDVEPIEHPRSSTATEGDQHTNKWLQIGRISLINNAEFSPEFRTLLYGVGEQPITSLMIFLATVSPWAPAKAAILCSGVLQQSPTAKILLWPDICRYSLT